MKKASTSIMLFFVVFFGFSQTEKDTVALLQDRTSQLNERTLSDNLDEKYTGEAFNYDIKTGESQNLLTRFLNWVSRGLQNIFGIKISPEAFKIMEYLIYVLMGGFIIYLIVRLLINEKFNSIFTKKARSISAIDITEQHIESIDLESLLENALKEEKLSIGHTIPIFKNSKTTIAIRNH